MQRILDKSADGFYGWPFMTVQLWGESSQGEWKLEVNNRAYFGSKFH